MCSIVEFTPELIVLNEVINLIGKDDYVTF